MTNNSTKIEKDTSSINVYSVDADYFNSIKESGQNQRDAFAHLMDQHKVFSAQTDGAKAASAAIGIIDKQSKKLREVVGAAALVAADELKIARESFEKRIAELDCELASEKERYVGEVAELRGKLAEATSEVKRLSCIEAERDEVAVKLSDAEASARRAEDAARAAKASEGAAQANVAKAQEKLSDAVEARREGEEKLGVLRAELTEAQNAAKIAGVEAAAKLENLSIRLESAQADLEAERNRASELKDRADDLRRQLESAQAELKAERGRAIDIEGRANSLQLQLEKALRDGRSLDVPARAAVTDAL